MSESSQGTDKRARLERLTPRVLCVRTRLDEGPDKADELCPDDPRVVEGALLPHEKRAARTAVDGVNQVVVCLEEVPDTFSGPAAFELYERLPQRIAQHLRRGRSVGVHERRGVSRLCVCVCVCIIYFFR